MDRKDEYQSAIVEETAAFRAGLMPGVPMDTYAFAAGLDLLVGVIGGGVTVLVYELRAIRAAIEAARGSGDFGGPG